MASILDIYSRYKIMKNLQQHMLRVSGVAAVICDHISVSVDKENIVKACLLHDMGNILKFDLEVFPEFLQPEGVEYWQQVKNEYEAKYGRMVHSATIKIARELGASQRVQELIGSISFNQEKVNFESEDFGRKICAYADMRVAPHGVVSLEERLADGRKRYPPKDGKKDTFSYVMGAYVKKIEGQIFEVCDIAADGITEEMVKKEFDKLSGVSF